MDSEKLSCEVDLEEEKLTNTLKKIKKRIAVFSGKGGVGKSSVSVNLAAGLQKNGFKTGIIDADVMGPNIAKMLGITEDIIVINETMIPFERFGIKAISVAQLVEKGQPLIWRGPMRSKVINQLIANVEWGNLDFLVADLPPGTGDEILTIAQELKPDYAVIVTTPQQVSIIDAERAVNLAKKLGIPLIGIVENMSGYICPHCNALVDIFGNGGGEKLAYDTNVEFLGEIPLDIDMRILGDKGVPIIVEKENCEASNSLNKIISGIIQKVSIEGD